MYVPTATRFCSVVGRYGEVTVAESAGLLVATGKMEVVLVPWFKWHARLLLGECRTPTLLFRTPVIRAGG